MARVITWNQTSFFSYIIIKKNWTNLDKQRKDVNARAKNVCNQKHIILVLKFYIWIINVIVFLQNILYILLKGELQIFKFLMRLEYDTCT